MKWSTEKEEYSAIVHVGLATNWLQLKPRSASPLGLFGRHDGNIIGGALLGAGMSIAAACPGTFMVQIGIGDLSGWYVLAGGALAGLVFTRFCRPILARGQQIEQKKTSDAQQPNLTVAQSLGVSRTTAFLAVEALCIGAVVATLQLSPSSPSTFPSSRSKYQATIGGLLIGLAQLVSIAARGSLIGVSTSFEEIGDWTWWALGGAKGGKPKASSMLFCLALTAGVGAVTILDPSLVNRASIGISPAKAMTGGFLMVLGSRIAGGCTSGHGISGVALLSNSSIITIGSSLVAGALVARFL